jgi:GT2 family glycosyltransferase
VSLRSGGSAPPGKAPRVAVLLLNWNGWKDTIECLESVLRLSYPHVSVVLCDNASTDGSVDKIRAWAAGTLSAEFSTPSALRDLVEPAIEKPIPIRELTRVEFENGAQLADGELTIIHNVGNLGFAGGNNVGLDFIRRNELAEYVWILNNDILVAPDSLTELMREARTNPSHGGIGATLFEYATPEEVQSVAGGLFPAWKGLSIPLKRMKYVGAKNGGTCPVLDYLSAGCMLVPTRVLTTVGLLDESYFMYAEDVDYSLRMRRAGLSLGFAPLAKVWHKGGGAVGHRSARHDYYIVRNSLQLVREYHPRMLPIATAYVAFRCALPKVVRGQWTRLAVLRRAYSDFKSGAFGPAPVLPGDARS